MTNKDATMGVLFDLDGVLIDTEGTYTQFWEAVDRRFPTGVDDFAQVIKGSNLHNILHTYFPTEQMRDQVTDMLNSFQHDMQYNFFPGAIELLEELHAKGIACCIVTSSDKRKMESLYAQHPLFPSHFDAIVTGNMVREPKPSPECFVLGAKLLGVDIAKCVVVEDSINGLRAGMASGAKVIGLYTTCSIQDIKPHCHAMAENIGKLTMQSILNIINS